MADTFQTILGYIIIIVVLLRIYMKYSGKGFKEIVVGIKDTIEGLK